MPKKVVYALDSDSESESETRSGSESESSETGSDSSSEEEVIVVRKKKGKKATVSTRHKDKALSTGTTTTTRPKKSKVVDEVEEEQEQEPGKDEEEEEEEGKKKSGKDVEVDEEEYYGKIRLDDDEVLETDENRVVVSLRNVHKTYLLGVEGVPALRGVTATIYKGEFVCIFGTSGGGKTTMLNIIGTIDRPSKGDIFLCGTHITPRTPDKVLSELRLEKMGFVFQTFNLLSAMTAVENVELPMILRNNMSAKERRDRALELLGRVGMKERANHLPSQLSGGEQQRVTIARAMANSPDILLLDEPTGDLDTHNTAVAMKLLSDLHKQGVTLIMVTHDVNLKYFADRVIWMRDGLVQRIEHTTPIQRKDCMDRMQAELSRKKKKVKKHKKPEYEIRQPESYEPFAYAIQRAEKNKEEQRRLMISLGLAPETSQDASGKEIQEAAAKKKQEKDSEAKSKKSGSEDEDADGKKEEKKEEKEAKEKKSDEEEKDDKLAAESLKKSHSHKSHKSSRRHRAQDPDEV